MQCFIPGFPYIITDQGEIYSLTGRNRRPRQQPIKLRASHRTIGRYKRLGRYIIVTIISDDGLRKRRVALHKLIAETFVPNPLGLKEVDHINRDSFDNRAENLRWVTHRENCLNRKRKR